MSGRPEERTGSSEAIRGTAAICARYAELIDASGLIEEAEAWRALGSTAPDLGGAVAVNRFADFEEPAMALLLGLSRANEVAVALTWEEGFAPTRALDVTVGRLKARADSVTSVPEPEATGELAELLDELYDGSAGIKSTGAVRMGMAAGSEAEASLVARIAAEEIASGTPPDRLVVAFPNLDAVADRLETAFAAEHLAIDIDIARPVSSTGLGRSLDGLLALSQGAGDRLTALGVLLGGNSDVAAEAVSDLDRSWRRDRVTDPGQLLEDLCDLKGSLLGRAAQSARLLAQSPVGPDTGKTWQLLLNLLLSAAAARAAARGPLSARDLAVRLERDADAARVVVRAVGEMASVEGSPFSVGDVRVSLRSIVAGGTAGERAGRVQITETARLRSRRFDTVIIGGLTAGEMPAIRSDSLADELRAAFSGESGGTGDERARFAFYRAISRARNRLVLVRRESDDRGAPVRPSVLWEEVVDAYRSRGDGAEGWPPAGPPAERLGGADIALTAPVFTEERRRLRQDTVRGRVSFETPTRGELTDPAVIEELGRIEVFSATEIEAYLQCPYRWFYERIVRPEEIDVEVDARAIGTFAHELLKAFYLALPDRTGALRVTPENVGEAKRVLDDVITAADLSVPTQGLAEELALARARRWVESAIADDAHMLPGFVPSHHEFSFGGPGESAVRLGGASFKGRIDRIDRSDGAAFVTDYKSSRSVSGYAKFADEAKIQAVVYALQAREAFGLPVAGSVYRSLRSRQMRGFWRPELVGGAMVLGHEADSIGEACFDELVAATAQRVEAAVAGIRAGRIPREPSVKNACKFCALQLQCEGATR